MRNFFRSKKKIKEKEDRTKAIWLRSDRRRPEDNRGKFCRPNRKSIFAFKSLKFQLVLILKGKGIKQIYLLHLFCLNFLSESTAKIDNVGIFSYITYAWVFPYLWSAFRGSIPRDQQWSCSIYDSANVNMARLEHLWRQEVAHPGRKGPSLAKVVYRFISARLWLSCAIFLFCLGFGFIGPVSIAFWRKNGHKPSKSSILDLPSSGSDRIRWRKGLAEIVLWIGTGHFSAVGRIFSRTILWSLLGSQL